MAPRWHQQVDRLLRAATSERDLSLRMHYYAESLLGRKYLTDPLIGGPEEPEELVVNLSEFDCVTFVETVVALARSRTHEGFLRELRQLRYKKGAIKWRERLHYFSDWFRSNEKRGAVRDDTKGEGSCTIETTLGLIPALPKQKTRFEVVPKRTLSLARDRIETGSVVAFATTRKRLDYFHVGLLFWLETEELWLYHAAKSADGVVCEPLDDFLARNRMRGITFASVQPMRR